MKEYNVAVVGATGVVGSEMLKILAERNFPINNLQVIASEKSAGKKILFNNNEYFVEPVKPGVFSEVDIALFSIGSLPSKKIVPQAVKEGAVVIDNSNAFRMDEGVPLVVPEINGDQLKNHQGIIANPNCSTIQLVLALKPIYDKFGIKRIVISTYQAVSGTGKAAINELEEQIKDFNEKKIIKSKVYPHQIAFNALPHIDVFAADGYTNEELKLIREPRKILNDDDLAITSTAVRIPVFYGHSESVNVETVKAFSVEELKEEINQMEGVKVIDKIVDNQYPLAIMAEELDEVMVGRIRRDNSQDNTFNMWIVANNLRKGAALNAIQIAEKLIYSI